MEKKQQEKQESKEDPEAKVMGELIRLVLSWPKKDKPKEEKDK